MSKVDQKQYFEKISKKSKINMHKITNIIYIYIYLKNLKNVELAGDFNVNFLDSKTNKSVQDFARLTFSHWLKEEIRNSNVQDGGRNYL